MSLIFNNELEQDFVYDFFDKVFQTQKLVRSYLFLGDSAADKKEFCFELAKTLNCDRNKGIWQNKLAGNQNTLFAVQEAQYQKACGECQNCQWLNEKAHPKTPIFVETSGAKKTIVVASARALNEELMQSSEFFRIIVFEDASKNTLKTDSANVLLKTIEEANPNTMFIFFSSSKENVLSTIVSRCQAVHFRPKQLKVELSEEAQDVKDKTIKLLKSQALHDPLERMIWAEDLANSERFDLIDAFKSLETDLSDGAFDLIQAKQVFLYEALIIDIKSFVKTKAALKDFIDKFVLLEQSLTHA